MHYNSDSGEFGPYMLSDYTEELASQNGVQKYIGDGVFTLDNLKKKFNEIMSMNVTPSTGTNLLDVTINTDLNMINSSGNVVEDTASITDEQYYGTKALTSLPNPSILQTIVLAVQKAPPMTVLTMVLMTDHMITVLTTTVLTMTAIMMIAKNNPLPGKKLINS